LKRIFSSILFVKFSDIPTSRLSSSSSSSLASSSSSLASSSSSLSSSDDVIKDTEEYVKFKQRKYFLNGIIGLLILAILLALTFAVTLTFVFNNNFMKNTTNIATSTLVNDNIVEYQSSLGKSKTIKIS